MKQEKHIYIVIVENVIWTPHKTHKIYLNLNYSSKIDAHMHASSMPYDSIEHKYNKKAIDFLVSFLRFFCAFRLLLFRFSSSHSNKKWMKCFHNIIFMYINRFSFKFFLQLSRRFLLQNSLVVCVSQCEHKWWYTLYVRRVYIHVHYIFRFFILLFDNKKKCTKLCVCCWRLYFIWSLMCASMWWEMNSLERIDERFSLFFGAIIVVAVVIVRCTLRTTYNILFRKIHSHTQKKSFQISFFFDFHSKEQSFANVFVSGWYSKWSILLLSQFIRFFAPIAVVVTILPWTNTDDCLLFQIYVPYSVHTYKWNPSPSLSQYEYDISLK